MTMQSSMNFFGEANLKVKLNYSRGVHKNVCSFKICTFSIRLKFRQSLFNKKTHTNTISIYTNLISIQIAIYSVYIMNYRHIGTSTKVISDHWHRA